jgi:hypothetical protein
MLRADVVGQSCPTSACFPTASNAANVRARLVNFAEASHKSREVMANPAKSSILTRPARRSLNDHVADVEKKAASTLPL